MNCAGLFTEPRLLRVRSLVLVVLAAGCTTHKPLPPPHPAPLIEARPVVDPPLSHVDAPETAEVSPSLPPELEKAMSTFLESGKAPLIHNEKAGWVQFPFGHSQPTVSCKPLALCDIELEPGEHLSDEGKHAIGLADPERWNVIQLTEGEGATQTAHVILKPNDNLPLQTDLLIATNRRLYHVHVVSGARQTVNARFYYPEQMLDDVNRRQARRAQEQKPVVATGVDPTTLHFAYAIACDQGVRYCPSQVFDDGRLTYLVLPRGLEAVGLPAVFVQVNGEDALVNYTVKLPYLVLQRVADRIILQTGTTKEAQRVTITREG